MKHPSRITFGAFLPVAWLIGSPELGAQNNERNNIVEITGIANNGSTWLVSAVRLYNATGTGTNLYRSTDNGATFTQVTNASTSGFFGNLPAIVYGNGRWIAALSRNWGTPLAAGLPLSPRTFTDSASPTTNPRRFLRLRVLQMP